MHAPGKPCQPASQLVPATHPPTGGATTSSSPALRSVKTAWIACNSASSFTTCEDGKDQGTCSGIAMARLGNALPTPSTRSPATHGTFRLAATLVAAEVQHNLPLFQGCWLRQPDKLLQPHAKKRMPIRRPAQTHIQRGRQGGHLKSISYRAQTCSLSAVRQSYDKCMHIHPATTTNLQENTSSSTLKLLAPCTTCHRG